MGAMTVEKLTAYNRVIDCKPDKSISIRAVLFNAYAHGSAKVTRLLASDDVLSAISCAKRLGAKIEFDGACATVVGDKFSSAKLDCRNSGTTARLLIGLLSGLDGTFEITGDKSLSTRPMRRVITPLDLMGAVIYDNDGKLPVKITRSHLTGIDYEMPIASAQVKSAILLAGLNAQDAVTVREKIKSRNHTETMLSAMNADISVDGNAVTVKPSVLISHDFVVPGDISSAAFPICLALSIKGGRCVVKNVGVNPTRMGLFDVLKRMGADLRYLDYAGGAEPYADVEVKYSALRPFEITHNEIPYLVDEIPVLCALACFIDGVSRVSGAGELRVKETDRIKTTVAALTALGADIEETEDGMIIRGGKPLRFGTVDPKLDHRIAMTAAVAGAAGGGVTIIDPECAAVSYPNFYKEVVL